MQSEFCVTGKFFGLQNSVDTIIMDPILKSESKIGAVSTIRTEDLSFLDKIQILENSEQLMNAAL